MDFNFTLSWDSTPVFKLYEFDIQWKSTPTQQAWLSVLTVTLQSTITSFNRINYFSYHSLFNNVRDYEFRFPYHTNVEPPPVVIPEYDSVFKFPYISNISYTIGDSIFTFKYKADHLGLSSYSFEFLYLSEKEGYPPEAVDHIFKLKFTTSTNLRSSYTYVYRYLSERTPTTEEVIHAFRLPYTIRTVSYGDEDSVISELIPLGNNIYDYTISVPLMRIYPGQHVVMIDSGSTYSSFFVKININDPGTYPSEVIAYSNHGVRLTIAWEGVDIQNMLIYVENIDIDSSISISAYREDDGEYVAMVNLWPKWSSFINEKSFDENGIEAEVLKDYATLVVLDSEPFKIFPLQPDSCCLLRTRELCELPPYREPVDIIPDPPDIPEIPQVEIPIGEMLLMIEEPRSNYIYEDSSRSVITATHVDATWDDITGMGEGRALESGVNPFVDINPTVNTVADSLFRATQNYQFNNYPINQLSELAAISVLEEASDNWGEGSLFTDFQFNPALRPRSNEISSFVYEMIDREYFRSTDAVIDRKQGYNLSMINGHIFTTQLIKIERDISYAQGQPTLTGKILPWNYMFEDDITTMLPNYQIMNDLHDVSYEGIDVSAFIVTEPEGTRPSSSDGDMID